MGHYYQDIDKTAFDYELVEYEGLNHKKFRGPAVDPSKPYIACIGAAQTYGRFCHRPFTHILSEKLGIQVMNLGVGGSGPEHFNNERYLGYLNGAELVILQVLSGRSASNSLFNNRESGGLLGVRLTDYKQMRFEQFLEELFAEGDHDKIARVARETRADYTNTFSELIRKINPPKILFWFSDRPPDYEDSYFDAYALLNRYPQLINRRVVENLSVLCDDVVEFSTDVGLPQKVFPGDSDVDGAKAKDGFLYNTYYPSPEMHEQSAELLVEASKPFVASPPRANLMSSKDEFSPFVILSAERTGSNLLSGQLDSHPDCLCANEIFNDYFIQREEIPMLSKEADSMTKNPDLLELRSKDPGRFVAKYFDMARSAGYKSCGFKLLYGQSEAFPSVMEYLSAQPSVSIIHLARRNLLRRYASEVKANITNVWAVGVDESAPPDSRFELKFDNCIWDIFNKDEMESKYKAMLAGRGRTLNVYYENLAESTAQVGARACRFLGLPENRALEVRFRKSGPDSLESMVSNYGELRGKFYRWLSYFDD